MNTAQKAAFDETVRRRGILRMAEGVVDRALEDLKKANIALNDAIIDDPVAWMEEERSGQYIEL